MKFHTGNRCYSLLFATIYMHTHAAILLSYNFRQYVGLTVYPVFLETETREKNDATDFFLLFLPGFTLLGVTPSLHRSLLVQAGK